jgi:hypothetical protein
MAKKIVDITKMNYTELVSLLHLNPELEIKAGTLFIILREFHKHLEKQYILVPKLKHLINEIKGYFNSIKSTKKIKEQSNSSKDQ